MAPGIALTTTLDDVPLGAQRILDEALSHVTEVAPDVVLRSYLSEAEAGPALVGQSKGADLLVVGRCGLGALRELLLGSVGIYCARHAHCPLVIVR